VADSAFARLAEMPEQRFAFLPAPLRLPLASSARSWAERLAGFSAAEVAPLVEVARIAPRPILFIHGEADGLIPVSHAHRLHTAAGPPKHLWLVPGAGHVRAHAADPVAYERRVIAFFQRSLAETSPTFP
jgi:fermentation-respiration switch protein FrsA (DUF1100 family)